MRRALLAICLTVAVTSGAQSPAVAWRTDWTDAFEAAKQEQRLVFVDYFATWCKPCVEMEATVFRDPEVLQLLSSFVLLRVDADRSRIPSAHRAKVYPTYAVFDPAQQERFRLIGAQPRDRFVETIRRIGGSAPAFLRAAGLAAAKRASEAELVAGNAYRDLGLTDDARKSYQRGRNIARKGNDKALEQLADALHAFTYVRDDDPERALTSLRKLVEKPADRETEALIWLTIGNTHRATLDPAAAIDAYDRSLASATAGGTAHKQAAIARAEAVRERDDPSEVELRKMQGHWLPDARKDGVTIRGRKWIEGAAVSVLRIDAITEPKKIDIRRGAVVVAGTYKLDADTLTITNASQSVVYRRARS